MSDDACDMLRGLIRSISKEIEELKLRIHRQRSSNVRHSCHRKSRSRSHVRSMLVPPNFRGKRQAMPLPLLLCGKRGHHALITAPSPGVSARSRVLFIHERYSGKRFMIDSGADVSAIPPTHADHQRPNSGFTLQAVNRTSIKTYGQRLLKLNLGRYIGFRGRGPV